MSARHRNDGLRKVCGCPRRKWPKCSHGWRINFKWKGVHHRYALDRLLEKKVRSKTDAESEAEKIRTAIREGTFRHPGQADDRPVLATLTLSELLDHYDRRYLSAERAKSSLQKARYEMAAIKRPVLTLPNGLPRAFGEWFVSDISTDTIEQFRAARRAAGAVAANRNLALLRAAFNWGIRVGILDTTPFKRGTETVVKLGRELPRRRRLEGDEAERLLAACGTHLRAVVEAALESGCRLGELLSLQWHQVRGGNRPEIVLEAGKTKTKVERRVPISSRLGAILSMRRAGPDGVEHPSDAYVFGNECGQRIRRVTRAWERAVLRAHGHTPKYTETGSRGLTRECRAVLRGINLHFHDLRREAGSRWLDGGVPLQTVRDWLGHANISQTSTYLASSLAGQHEAMRAFEEYQARVQQSATEVGTGHHTKAHGATVGNTKTPESTGKHH